MPKAVFLSSFRTLAALCLLPAFVPSPFGYSASAAPASNSVRRAVPQMTAAPRQALVLTVPSSFATQKFRTAARNGDVDTLRQLWDANPTLSKELTPALFDALYGFTPKAIDFLLERGANANATSSTGMTPLLEAIGGNKDNLAVIQTLVAHGAKVNSSSQRGGIPLHLSVSLRRRDVALFLLQQGARDTTTPIYDALAQNDAAGVITALQEKPQLANLPSSLVPFGQNYTLHNRDLTPLHAAVFWNRAPLIKILLDAKANPETLDRNGETALHEAAAQDAADCAAVLLEGGADVNAEAQRVRLPRFDSRKFETHHTPLHLAATANALSVAKILIEHGAKIDASTLVTNGFDVKANRSGQTPLQYAISALNPSFVSLLLEHGAKANGLSSEGSPLLLALNGRLNWFATSKNRESLQRDTQAIVAVLLEHGANPNVRDPLPLRSGTEDTALTKAIAGHDKALVTLLLKAKADANLSTAQGVPPLQLSLTHQSQRDANYNAIPALLLEGDANVAARDKLGNTPLLVAVKYDNLELTHQLIERGADVMAKDKSGTTALALSFSKGTGKITALLRANGATDPTVIFFDALDRGDAATVKSLVMKLPRLLQVRDESQQAPLAHAMQNEQYTMVPLLISLGADVEMRSWGEPALFEAVNSGKPDLIALLLKHGAKVNENSDEHYPPLIRAVSMSMYPHRHNAQIIALLLKAGAKPNAIEETGKTPLHVFLEVSASPKSSPPDMSVMDALLKAGANMNAPDFQGQTPLHIAATVGNSAGAAWLLNHQAKVNSRDKKGWTPLRQAQESKHTQLVDLFQMSGGTL